MTLNVREFNWWIGLKKHRTYKKFWITQIKGVLLPVKINSYDKTGAVLAAATTNHYPEHLGEVRNWLFRFWFGFVNALNVIKVVSEPRSQKRGPNDIYSFNYRFNSDKDENSNHVGIKSVKKKLTENDLRTI